jgi:hypothetical protein
VSARRNIVDINVVSKNLVELSKNLHGHLTEKEARFLACLPFISITGEILEIGSFKGKSTIILGSAAKIAGMNRIVACDPLLLSSPTDPRDADRKTLPDIFKTNLTNHGLSSFVEFHQKMSSELAVEWKRLIKVLWIDGDHTYTGACMDVDLFSPFIAPGGIICLHDVLHGHDGPLRAFIERIVLSEKYADCGCCGSIGWGQYIGDGKLSEEVWNRKLSLYIKLSRLVPFVVKSTLAISNNKSIYKLKRALVPHGDINPSEWVKERNEYAKKLPGHTA